MGSSFANLQVRIASGPEAVSRVRAVFDAAAAAEGMFSADSEPDRSVVVVPGAGWVAIYDQASESEDIEPLVQALSRAVGPCVGVLVHDSDLLQLTLACDGAVVDRYDSNPGFSGRGKRRPPGPHARAWADALGVPESSLLAVFGDESLFAEAALVPLAAALGLDPSAVATGFHYLGEAPLPEGAVQLRYRLRDRPAWDARFTGPPRLGAANGGPTVEVAVGAELRVSVTARNHGGPSTGLVVTLASPPWFTAHRVELLLGDPLAARHGRRALQVAEAVGGAGQFSAAFPEAALPAGGPDPDARAFAVLGVQKAMALRAVGQVHVNVVGVATEAGTGAVQVRLVPHAHPAGAAAGGATVTARDTADRPLRAPSTVHPSLLKPLAGRDQLVALVAGPDAAALAALCAAIAPSLPAAPKVRWTVFPRAAGGFLGAMLGSMKAPKVRTVKAVGFLGAPFAKLAADVPTSVAVLECAWVEDAESREPSASMQLGVGLVPTPRALPAIALTIGPAGDRDTAEAALGEAIDALARSGGVVQALVCRWGQAISLEFTPYEQATGVMGQCTLERAWVERWLRGVGVGTVWLGPALRAHLPAVAGVQVGEVLRVTVTDVAEAERALAPILPAMTDWQAGVAARYR